VGEQLYRFRHGEGGFELGTASGKQLLIGSTVHHVVLHCFDPDGRFLELEKLPMAVAPDTFPGTSIYKTDAIYWRQTESEIEAIKARIGFVPADILVREFKSDEASIEDLPLEFADFLQSPDSYDEADCKSIEAAIRQWRERGCFVLSWEENFWIAGSGEVISC
jgi:hypothetical protein